MKTPTLRKYESKLIEVNDQLCYFLLSDSEFEALLSNKSKSESSLFTTEVFPKNQFSERLHIKLVDLPSHRKRAFHTLVGISHIASSEYMISYIEEIEKYRSEVHPSAHDSISDKKTEEQLSKKLKQWSGMNIDSGLVKTVKYLRLRRNHVAHVKDDMSDELRALVKNDGNHLNNYWATKPTDLYDFDFSNQDYSSFSVNEVLALINLTRVSIRLIDEAIISTLTMSEIAQHEVRVFLQNKSLNGLTVQAKHRKFRGFLQHRYGATFFCTEDDYNSYASNV